MKGRADEAAGARAREVSRYVILHLHDKQSVIDPFRDISTSLADPLGTKKRAPFEIRLFPNALAEVFVQRRGCYGSIPTPPSTGNPVQDFASLAANTRGN